MDRVIKIETGKLALQTVLHDFLGKDCMAGSVLLYFLFSLVITHARSPRRTCIKFMLGLCAVPLEGYVHVNVSLLFVFCTSSSRSKKIIQTAGSTCYGNSKFNHFFFCSFSATCLGLA